MSCTSNPWTEGEKFLFSLPLQAQTLSPANEAHLVSKEGLRIYNLPGECLTCWPGSSCLQRRLDFLSCTCEVVISSVHCGAHLWLSHASWGSSAWAISGSSDSPELRLLLLNDFAIEWGEAGHTHHMDIFSVLTSVSLLDHFWMGEVMYTSCNKWNT